MTSGNETSPAPLGRPGALLIGELNVHDEAAMAEYGLHAIPMLERYGAEILAICPPNAETVEGEPTGRTLIIHSWPDVDRFKDFYNSEEYRPVKPIRLGAADARLTLVKTLPSGWKPRALR
jgi:uncharacterized protein (DUF1330 family)